MEEGLTRSFVIRLIRARWLLLQAGTITVVMGCGTNVLTVTAVVNIQGRGETKQGSGSCNKGARTIIGTWDLWQGSGGCEKGVDTLTWIGELWRRSWRCDKGVGTMTQIEEMWQGSPRCDKGEHGHLDMHWIVVTGKSELWQSSKYHDIKRRVVTRVGAMTKMLKHWH